MATSRGGCSCDYAEMRLTVTRIREKTPSPIAPNQVLRTGFYRVCADSGAFILGTSSLQEDSLR